LTNAQKSNFVKNCPVGAELFLTDGEMDKQNDKSNSRFLHFCKCT